MQKTWSEDKLEANNYREKEREREPNNNRKKERDRTRQQQKKTKNRKKEKYKRMKEIEKDTIEGTIKFLFTKKFHLLNSKSNMLKKIFSLQIILLVEYTFHNHGIHCAQLLLEQKTRASLKKFAASNQDDYCVKKFGPIS